MANRADLTAEPLVITSNVEVEGRVKYGGSRCGRESNVSIFLPQMQCRN